MIKITALNEELSEESDDENIPALTKEAEVLKIEYINKLQNQFLFTFCITFKFV